MKTVVITGSDRWLGLEMAKCFIGKNFNVVISDLYKKDLDNARMELLKIKSSKVVLNNTFLGNMEDGRNIFSPVSGKVLGIKEMFFNDKKSNCLVVENDFIDRREKLNPSRSISKMKKSELKEITPKSIFDELSKHVIGQTEAKRILSVALYQHYKSFKINNIDSFFLRVYTLFYEKLFFSNFSKGAELQWMQNTKLCLPPGM